MKWDIDFWLRWSLSCLLQQFFEASQCILSTFQVDRTSTRLTLIKKKYIKKNDKKGNTYYTQIVSAPKKKEQKYCVCTASLGVKGSYPEPPEAKQTPVMRSWGCRFGSKYAGKSSLISNSAAKSWNGIKKCTLGTD